MIKFLEKILTSLLQLNPVVTLVTAGFTFAIGVFKLFGDMWGYLMTKLATLVLPGSFAASALDGYEFLNFFLPLEEAFTFVAAYYVALGVVTLIRIIKSFIPTVN